MSYLEHTEGDYLSSAIDQEVAFENSLFTKGTLDYTEAYRQEKYSDLIFWKFRVGASLYQSETYYQRDVASRLNVLTSEILWRKLFSEKIPRKWESPTEIYMDFFAAAHKHLQLNEDLVDAGISHWEKPVVKFVAFNQMLTVPQITRCLLRPIIEPESFIACQRQMGVTSEEIMAARSSPDLQGYDVRQNTRNTNRYNNPIEHIRNSLQLLEQMLEPE